MNKMNSKKKNVEQQSAPTFTVKEYNSVAMNASLRAIVLTLADFVIKPEYFSTEEAKREFSYGGDMSEFSFNSDIGVAQGTYNWTVLVKCGRRVLLKANATYVTLYDSLHGRSRDAVEVFLGTVGQIATYPYFRNRVSQLSWEANANLPLLPSQSFDPNHQRQDID
ncbi:hypothetical protein [Iodidimonas sp. SYSU 1G8]|uniref:hypothetical protein n=1 Tax=Iodidimonas sp. SYSU 1G8 TaxID=3133967 RepID=UPI0031FED166